MERFALIFFTLTAPNVSAIISKTTCFFDEIFRGCLLGPEGKIEWVTTHGLNLFTVGSCLFRKHKLTPHDQTVQD